MISKLTCSVLLIFFFISASYLSSQTLHFDKLKLKESFQRIELSIDSLNDSNNIKLTEKSPLFAGAVSFIVPGFAVGQLYNGQTNKFFTHSLISTGLIVSFFMLEGKPSDINLFGTPRTISMGSLAFMLAYTINWTWSIVDAVISANNINKQIKLRKYRSGVLDKLKFGLTIDKNKNLNLKFVLEL